MRKSVLLAFILLVKLHDVASQSGGCEAGWSRSPDKCFSLFGIAINGENRLTWTQADEACKAMGATLATIPNAQTQPILTAILVQAPSSNVWIGLTDLSLEDTFHWVDGTELVDGFTNWGPNQPDDGGDGQEGFEEDCVYLHAMKDYPGEWYDGFCDYPRAYICEKPQDPVLPTLSPSLGCFLPPDKQYIIFERACYKLDTTVRSYDDSVQVCLDDTAEIVSIENAFEEAFIEAFLLNAEETSAWIGLKTQKLIDNLVWSDNRRLIYTNWGLNRPTTTKNCGIFTDAGWQDEECDQNHAVFCKKSLARDPSPPIPLGGFICPDGMQPGDDYCSAWNNSTKCTWEEAQAMCRDLHDSSTLASMHNLNEKNTIGLSLPLDEDMWIGLQSSERDQFVWDDGSVLDYVNFNGSEVKDQCVSMIHPSSSPFDSPWNTRNCSERLGFVCRAPKIFIPSPNGGCSPGWFRLGDKCLHSVGVKDADRRDFADAEEHCIEQGAGRGKLYHVNNQVRQSMLVLLLQGFDGQTNLWIGLSDSQSEGEFMWTDGTPLGEYTQWAPNQPDGFTSLPNEPYRDCVEVKADPHQLGKWDDINCLERRGFICETYLDPQLTSNDTAIQEMCDGSYSDYTKYNDSCYKLINKTATYAEARTMCGDDNAWVTRSRDGNYNSLLTLIMNVFFDPPPPVWISLTQDSMDTYKWETVNSGEDNWPFTYANWDQTMPSGFLDRCSILQEDSTWKTVPCDEEHYVICQYTDTKPEPEDSSQVHCPDGWTLIERHCYRFDTLTPEQPQIHFTFTEAELECKLRYNATLPGIHSSTANNAFRIQALSSLGKRNVWLGLHLSLDGYYSYEDKRIINYVNWDQTTPWQGSECVGLDTESGKWKASHCFSMAGLVCETVPLPGQGNPCPSSWSNDMDACYYISDSSNEDSWMSWNDAEKWCNMNKGHLTTLEKGRERDYIKGLLYAKTESFWIGLNNIDTPGDWIWSDGTSYDSTTAEWSPDDVRNEFNMQYCVVINQNDEWEDHNCGIRRPFICKWNTNQEEPIIVTEAPLIGQCSPGSYRLRDRCYDLTSMTEEKTWLEAHKECQFRSGELASIHDPGVQALLSNSLQDVQGSVWIGMSRYGIYDQYYWSDGSTDHFTNWALGEPNSPYQQEGNDDSIDFCVEMVNNPSYAGKWSDVNCDKQNGFICQKSLDPTEKEQPLPFQLCPGTTDYLGYKDSCYKIITYTASNPNAEKECTEEGAFLASVGDAYDQAFVEMLMAYFEVESAWIGLRRGSNDQFEWLDGWPTVYTSWMAGYPTGSSNLNRCVIITSDGWRNVDCYDSYSAVCKTTTADQPDPPQPPTGKCPRNWYELQQKCYYFDTERPEVSYLEAYAFCQDMGPEVFPASCENSGVNTFLQNTARSVLQVSNLWLGLFYQNEEFKWSDGSPYIYTNWKSDLPEMPIEADACVQLDTAGAGQWKNTDCFVKAGYVCIGPMDTTTAVMPTTTEQARPSSEPQTVLSFEAVIGLGVGGGVIGAVVILSIFCYMRENRREKYKKSHQVRNDPSFERA